MNSRIAQDSSGRAVAIIRLRTLPDVELGHSFLILDGRTVGLLPTRARKPTRASAEAQKQTYTPNLSRQLREQPAEQDDELDENAAIEAAYREQRRSPPDLVNVAA
jgi:hypothetical protein